MYRILPLAVSLLSVLLVLPMMAQSEEQQTVAQDASQAESAHPLDVTPYDIVIGHEDAPLTIVEYASLTCSHCARFHKETYDEVKKNYVDTGKVRFVFRHMPWDNMALAAAKLAVCSGDAAPAYVSAFLKTVDTWAKAADPLAELKKVGKLGGMSEQKIDQCLQDTTIHQQVLETQRVGKDVLKVRSTPTFFVGPNVVVEGFRTYETFHEVLDNELSKLEAE